MTPTLTTRGTVRKPRVDHSRDKHSAEYKRAWRITPSDGTWTYCPMCLGAKSARASRTRRDSGFCECHEYELGIHADPLDWERRAKRATQRRNERKTKMMSDELAYA